MMVAPRLAVSGLPARLRLLLLVSTTWAAAIVVVCVAVMAPLLLGRLLAFCLQLPSWLRHDPMLFFLGGVLTVCLILLDWVAFFGIVSSTLDVIPLNTALQAVFMACVAQVIDVVVGATIKLSFITRLSEVWRIGFIVESAFLGGSVVFFLHFFFFVGLVEWICQGWGVHNPSREWVGACNNLLRQSTASFIHGHLDLKGLKLRALTSRMLRPVAVVAVKVASFVGLSAAWAWTFYDYVKTSLAPAFPALSLLIQPEAAVAAAASAASSCGSSSSQCGDRGGLRAARDWVGSLLGGAAVAAVSKAKRGLSILVRGGHSPSPTPAPTFASLVNVCRLLGAGSLQDDGMCPSLHSDVPSLSRGEFSLLFARLASAAVLLWALLLVVQFPALAILRVMQRRVRDSIFLVGKRLRTHKAHQTQPQPQPQPEVQEQAQAKAQAQEQGQNLPHEREEGPAPLAVA